MAKEIERLAVIETDIKYIKKAVDEIRSVEKRIDALERKAAWYAGGIAVISGGLGFIGSNLKAFVHALTTT
jgi:hypothetical protein